MSYTITLTPEEHETLAWLADRGYDCGLFDALDPVSTSILYTSERTHTIPEHKAWDINEQNNEHEAWTCLAWESTLGVKISAFLESIV